LRRRTRSLGEHPSGHSQLPTGRSGDRQRAEGPGEEIISTKMAEEKKVTEAKKEVKEEAKVDKEVEVKEVRAEAKATEIKKEDKNVPAEKEKKAEKDNKKAEKEDKKEDKKDKKKKEETVDIVSENVYIIPLKAAYQTKPNYRRAIKAVKILQKYLIRHTKSENVKIDGPLNQHIWSRGACKPPRKVQIKAVKDSEGKVVASLLK